MALNGRYQLIRDLSENVVDEFADHSFDLVFVDGPHTYRHVNRDITNYQSKVKKGGFLVGHDFSCVHPPLLWGVTEQRLHGQVINYGMDGTWWWQEGAGDEDENAGGGGEASSETGFREEM